MPHNSSNDNYRPSFDVCILGAGFGGSLLAWILAKQGRRVLLLDRGQHPRFAIGESSTPVGNMTLRRLAAEYSMPELLALSRYGTWKETFPDLGVGCKRGFSYFFHTASQPFCTDSEHSGELLVAANANDATADTHWVRADIDAWLCQQARLAGAVVRERTIVTDLARDNQWCLQLSTHENDAGPVADSIRADYLVDATGGAAATSPWLPIQNVRTRMTTNSRALFAHFSHVGDWTKLMSDFGYSVKDHPFDCDQAAQHHVIDEGWLWALRFSHNLASIGFMFDCHPRSGRVSNIQLDSTDPADLWRSMLAKYPALQSMLSDARIVAPTTGIQLSKRIQTRWAPCAGDGWALLPSTAGFVDPLHSTGIAHTLLGVERLTKRLLQPSCTDAAASEWSQRYTRVVDAELSMIDQLVQLCYLTRHEPIRFTSSVMLYFAAVTSYERQANKGPAATQPAFLLAKNSDWCHVVSDICQRAKAHASGSACVSAVEFENVVRRQIAAFNVAGLCDPDAHRMYRFTVAPD
ncbi:MAG: FAD-dependent oxidoreductase [Planctomycetaceae bacterium]|nr:FAD-dependent oxidoreductase [Planctomycetaceae bacterium]